VQENPSSQTQNLAAMGRKPSAAAATSDHESLVATMPADLLAAAYRGGIHWHALFIDALVQLIPPRFYLPCGDEDRLWYQGLSKVSKAAMKVQSGANVKAARRARLDPFAPPASTLDLLKKSVADQAEAEEEEEDDDVTLEELEERLRRRIVELQGNRCTGHEFLNKPKEEKGKNSKAKNEKMGEGDGKKRKRDDGTEEGSKNGKKVKKEVEEKPEIMYANVFVDPKEARRMKKRRVKNKKKALEQAKRL
jgi:hypothetical protein